MAYETYIERRKREEEGLRRNRFDFDSSGDIGIPIGNGMTIDSSGDIGFSIGGGLTIDSGGDIGFKF